MKQEDLIYEQGKAEVKAFNGNEVVHKRHYEQFKLKHTQLNETASNYLGSVNLALHCSQASQK